jgi:membrane protease YdiL (CAAX protease family)
VHTSLFLGPDGLRPFWALLLYLAILLCPVLLLGLASHLASPDAPQPHPTGLSQLSPLVTGTTEWLQFGFVLFATWIMSRVEDRSVFTYGLREPRGSLRTASMGLLWGFLCMSLLIGVLWMTHHLVFTGVLLRPRAAFGYGAAWGLNFLGVGFFEEFLFRGYLQFVLARCFAGLIRFLKPGAPYATAAGFWLAAILISFGFGLVHGSNPGESPVGLLCAGLAGLLFAFSLWRTGALWWAIGFHASWDWAQSFLFGVADSGTAAAGHLLDSHPAGPLLLSGGATGPEGSLFVLPVLLLVALIIAFTLRGSAGYAAQSCIAASPAIASPELHAPPA